VSAVLDRPGTRDGAAVICNSGLLPEATYRLEPGRDQAPRRNSLPNLFTASFGTALFIEISSHLLPDGAQIIASTVTWTTVGLFLTAILATSQRFSYRTALLVVAITLSCAGVLFSARQGWPGNFVFAGLVACASAVYVERFQPGFTKDTLTLCSLPLITYGIIQWIGLDWYSWTYVSYPRVHAGIGNANHLAAYLAMVVAATLAPSSRLSKKMRTLIGVLAAMLLLATESRSALAVTTAVIAVVIALWSFKRVGTIAHRAAIAAALFGLTSGFLLAVASIVVDRFGLKALLSDGSFATRLDVWQSFPNYLRGIEWLIGDMRARPWLTGSFDNFLLDFLMGYGVLGCLTLFAIPWLLAMGGPRREPQAFVNSSGATWHVVVLAVFVFSLLPHAITVTHVILLLILLGATAVNLHPGHRFSLNKPTWLMPALIVGVVIMLGLVALHSFEILPFRPPDSPGIFPYPNPSPLPTWLGIQMDAKRLALIIGVTALAFWAHAKAILSIFRTTQG